MSTFAIEIWEDSLRKCTFYTVRKEGVGLSEMDKFFTRFKGDTEYKHVFDDLLTLLIEDIGNRHGALDDFFDRVAASVDELPPKPKIFRKGNLDVVDLGLNFPLRLFCLRINKGIVVLFNGGLKTSQKTQDSPELKMKFHEAKIFVKGIIEGIANKEILIAGRYLEDFEGNKTDINIF